MLDSLHIKNFRCFEDLTIPSLGRVNLIVGKNNSGKSTLLDAIYVFSQAGLQEALLDILYEKNEFSYLDRPQTKDFAKLFPNRELKGSESFLSIGNLEKNNCINIAYKKEKTNQALDDEIFQLDIYRENNHAVIYLGHSFDINYKTNVKLYSCKSVPTTLMTEDAMNDIWDELILSSHDTACEEWLRLIIPDFQQLLFIKSPSGHGERVAFLKFKDTKKNAPLKSFGEGVYRLLQIYLKAFQAQGGYLLIDEFENGLHYSIQDEIWSKIFLIAKELNIQVFASTHSRDALEAFSKVAIENKEVEGKLITLGKNAGKTNRGRIISHAYNEEELEWIVNTRTEIR
jgi:AAA15 family ATPase/GTPase